MPASRVAAIEAADREAAEERKLLAFERIATAVENMAVDVHSTAQDTRRIAVAAEATQLDSRNLVTENQRIATAAETIQASFDAFMLQYEDIVSIILLPLSWLASRQLLTC